MSIKERLYGLLDRLEKVRKALPLIVVLIAVMVACVVLYTWPGSASKTFTAPPAPYTQSYVSSYSFSFGRGTYEVIVRPAGIPVNVGVSCQLCSSSKPKGIELSNVTDVKSITLSCNGGVLVTVSAVVPPFHEKVAEVVVKRVAP